MISHRDAAILANQIYTSNVDLISHMYISSFTILFAATQKYSYYEASRNFV